MLGHQPARSSFLEEKIAGLEKDLGHPFPGSVREWYTLAGATSLLAEYSNDDHVVPLDRLSQVEAVELVDGVKVPGGCRVVVILHENQHVCKWGFTLDTDDDPAVVVCDNDYLHPSWRLCADRFSTFVYTRIWDYLGIRQAMDGIDELSADAELSASTLSFLRANLTEEPQTLGWPAEITYRFSVQRQHLHDLQGSARTGTMAILGCNGRRPAQPGPYGLGRRGPWRSPDAVRSEWRFRSG